MSKLQKVFLALSGLLGLTTIVVSGFIIFTTPSESEDVKAPERLGSVSISCSSKIKPSNTFWTENKFK